MSGFISSAFLWPWDTGCNTQNTHTYTHTIIESNVSLEMHSVWNRQSLINHDVRKHYIDDDSSVVKNHKWGECFQFSPLNILMSHWPYYYAHTLINLQTKAAPQKNTIHNCPKAIFQILPSTAAGNYLHLWELLREPYGVSSRTQWARSHQRMKNTTVDPKKNVSCCSCF